jgi:hypothetical protein
MDYKFELFVVSAFTQNMVDFDLLALMFCRQKKSIPKKDFFADPHGPAHDERGGPHGHAAPLNSQKEEKEESQKTGTHSRQVPAAQLLSKTEVLTKCNVEHRDMLSLCFK